MSSNSARILAGYLRSVALTLLPRVFHLDCHQNVADFLVHVDDVILVSNSYYHSRHLGMRFGAHRVSARLVVGTGSRVARRIPLFDVTTRKIAAIEVAVAITEL